MSLSVDTTHDPDPLRVSDETENFLALLRFLGNLFIADFPDFKAGMGGTPMSCLHNMEIGHLLSAGAMPVRTLNWGHPTTWRFWGRDTDTEMQGKRPRVRQKKEENRKINSLFRNFPLIVLPGKPVGAPVGKRLKSKPWVVGFWRVEIMVLIS